MPVKLASRTRPHRAVRAACIAVLLASSGIAVAQEHFPLPPEKPEIMSAPHFSNPPLPLDKPFGVSAPVPEPAPDPAPETDAGAPQEAAEEPPEPLEPLERPWTAKEVAAGRAQCTRLLSDLAIEWRETETIGVAEGCGISAPVIVSRIGAGGAVEISPEATLNCTHAAALYTWIEDTLILVSQDTMGSAITRIQNVSSYVCRRRNNNPEGKLSEHALGNALDIAAFSFANGTTVTVKDDWPQGFSGLVPDDAATFLKSVHEGACEVFSTVLGPDANASHADHFHLDLGRSGRYLICE